MKFHFALIALAAVACTGDKTTESGDTGGTTGGGTCPDGIYDGPVSIDTASAKCDAAGNISYEAKTTGLTADGYVWAIESGNNQPWDEEHDLKSYEFDSCGSYDKLNVTIQSGEFPDYVRNQASTFNCDKIGNPATMTFAFAVMDVNGDLADCLVGGEDPTGVIAGDYAPYFGTGPTFDLSTCHSGTVAI
jgi:hypothetical protein